MSSQANNRRNRASTTERRVPVGGSRFVRPSAIDIVPGRGNGFSLEAPEDVGFVIRSRLLADEELDSLDR